MAAAAGGGGGVFGVANAFILSNDKPLSGNPAAVCILPEGTKEYPEDAKLQALAEQMNLSETAFVLIKDVKRDESIIDARIRWFTPNTEVDLCGHATLASAHVMFTKYDSSFALHFVAKGGNLVVKKSGDMLEMEFPATPPKTDSPSTILGMRVDANTFWSEAFGVDAANVVCCGKSDYDVIVQVTSQQVVESVKPNLHLLGSFASVRGWIVTSESTNSVEGKPLNFVSRFFAPACAVDEDPVTGSAHCCLTPFWASKLGNNKLHAMQIHPRRPGLLQVELCGDRVMLRGLATQVLSAVYPSELL